MAVGSNIRTWFEGTWHEGDTPVMRAADHGAWLGSSVFDGARYFEGVSPDLDRHLARINASAEALMITPTHSVEEMAEIVAEGLAMYPKDAAVYIRPMYWAIDGDRTAIVPLPERTGFAICLEEIPLAPEGTAVSLTETRFRRPTLDVAVVNAKAGCLYPNNARMLREANARGFQNALCLDVMGNLAESATANVFLVRDGVVQTPIANGTFLAGITRARHIENLRRDGVEVQEAVLTYADVHAASEVFLSGNMNKVTPVARFDETHFQPGPMTRRVREMYWDWALSGA